MVAVLLLEQQPVVKDGPILGALRDIKAVLILSTLQ